jgi:hypothetical protein
MNLSLSLSPEIEARLLERSAITGKGPEELALSAIEDQLLVGEKSSESLSAEEWVADIRAWANSHRRLPHEADDSRESIYAGRG